MAQQDFNLFAPLIKVDADTKIPFAGMDAQTRNGKDEIIIGSVPFVRNASDTLWVPVSATDRLPTQEASAADIKTAVEALAALIDSGALKTTLTGRKALGRADIDLSDGQVHDLGSPPAGATQFVGRVEGGSIRAWWDGDSDPSSTSGVLAEDGDTISLVTADDIANFAAIAASGAPTIRGHFA